MVYKTDMKKYVQEIDLSVDLHGYTLREAERVLDELLREHSGKYVRIIVGRGVHSKGGPVLGGFVRRYLAAHNIDYRPAKIRDGGEGALLVRV